VRWYNLLTDIHARKQSEEQLQRSEADLLEAQRLSHCGSWRHAGAHRSDLRGHSSG